jgi:hypothetical protein
MIPINRQMWQGALLEPIRRNCQLSPCFTSRVLKAPIPASLLRLSVPRSCRDRLAAAIVKPGLNFKLDKFQNSVN